MTIRFCKKQGFRLICFLVILIIGLWIFPFTWGIASLTTLIFVAIAIPLAIIVLFMTQTLHIQTAGIPMLSCFDKDTPIVTTYGIKKIAEINVGDMTGSGLITGVLKLNAVNVDMYNLNGIIVSGTHMVKHNKWIKVSEHPLSIKIVYSDPYIYCLNTSSKKILINDMIFGDWDELYNKKMRHILNIKTTKIHKYFDGGFIQTTQILLKNPGKGHCF